MNGELEARLVCRKADAQVAFGGVEGPFEVDGYHNVEHLDEPEDAAEGLALDGGLDKLGGRQRG